MKRIGPNQKYHCEVFLLLLQIGHCKVAPTADCQLIAGFALLIVTSTIAVSGLPEHCSFSTFLRPCVTGVTSQLSSMICQVLPSAALSPAQPRTAQYSPINPSTAHSLAH